MLEEAFNADAPKRKTVGNTVGGAPEQLFRQAWISTLAHAMRKTGKGFRMDSPKRQQRKGAAKWRGERRADKVGTSKLERRLMTGVA